MQVYHSVADARRQVSEWEKQYPGAEFSIRPYALGNKVAYQIVQVNRFGNNETETFGGR